MPQQASSPKRTGLLAEAQQQAESAAATLIERKFKEPANLEVFIHRLGSHAAAGGQALPKGKSVVRACSVCHGPVPSTPNLKSLGSPAIHCTRRDPSGGSPCPAPRERGLSVEIKSNHKSTIVMECVRYVVSGVYSLQQYTAALPGTRHKYTRRTQDNNSAVAAAGFQSRNGGSSLFATVQ